MNASSVVFTQDAPAAPVMPASGTVLVTGATGFLAGFVIRDLLAEGYRVRGTMRNVSRTDRVAHLSSLCGAAERLEFVQADLVDAPSMTQAVTGCVAVVHVATPVCLEWDDADITKEKLEAEQIRPTIEGTTHLMNAAVDAGVTRFVLTSSGASMLLPDFTPGTERDFTDTTPFEPAMYSSKMMCYVICKAKQELKAWEVARQRNLHLTVLHPAVIYGPMLGQSVTFSHKNFIDLVNFGRGFDHLPVPAPPGTMPNFTLAVVDVRDVSRVHVNALKHPQPPPRCIIQSGCIHLQDLADEVSRRLPTLEANIPKATHLPDGQKKMRSRDLSDLEQPESYAPGEVPFSASYATPLARLAYGVQLMPWQDTVYDTIVPLAAYGYIPALNTEAAPRHSIVSCFAPVWKQFFARA